MSGNKVKTKTETAKALVHKKVDEHRSHHSHGGTQSPSSHVDDGAEAFNAG
jgi:hypothetical protein